MLRDKILDALYLDAQGNIAKAKANIEVYLHQPVGIGEHPDVLGAIQEQVDIIAHEQERIQVLEKHFLDSNPFAENLPPESKKILELTPDEGPDPLTYSLTLQIKSIITRGYNNPLFYAQIYFIGISSRCCSWNDRSS